MRKRHLLTRLALGAAWLAWAAAAEATPSFTGLGNLGGATPLSNARAVSLDGSTVVGNSIGPSGQEAFIWTR